MEQNSQVEILESQIRECFGRLVWTHTTHQKCIDLLEKKREKNKKVANCIKYYICNRINNLYY